MPGLPDGGLITGVLGPSGLPGFCGLWGLPGRLGNLPPLPGFCIGWIDGRDDVGFRAGFADVGLFETGLVILERL
jgi:hypothetical protein